MLEKFLNVSSSGNDSFSITVDSSSSSDFGINSLVAQLMIGITFGVGLCLIICCGLRECSKSSDMSTPGERDSLFVPGV